jgi:hypothetical protein
MSAALRVATHVPTRVSSLRDDVSEAASSVIARALAKEPSERHASARELSVDLRRAFQLDLGELPERLMQAARSDFFDPRFPELTKTVELAAIDRAWRELPTAGPLSQPPRRGPSANSIPTLAADPPTIATSAGKSALATWLLLACAVLAVAFAVAFFATRQPGEDRVVFVEAHKREAPPPAPPVAPLRDQPPKASASELTTPKPPASARTSAEPLKREGTSSLTRAFAARRKEVERCFTQHSASLSGAPRVYVEFEISAAGQVRTAQLDPDAVAETALGRCVLAIAESTRFDPQAAELRFRIPLTARSQ